MSLIFYVYAYLRNKDSKTAKAGTPYYLGKGSGKRAWRHLKNDVTHPPKDKSNIIIIERNLSEIGAFVLERRYIEWYGRIDIGTGILRNRTDGGPGVSGRKRTENEKKNISLSLTGRKRVKRSQKTIDKWKITRKFNNICPSDETIKKRIDTKKKNGTLKHSEETKLKIGLSNKGKVAYNKGIPMKESSKEKLKNTKSSNKNPAWNKGKKLPKFTQERKDQCSALRKGKKLCHNSDTNESKFLFVEFLPQGWVIGKNKV